MKILVTGANGQVGSCLVRQLTGKHDLLAVNRKILDITDEFAVNQIINDFTPDVIINAAAYTAVDSAEAAVERTYKVNRDGALYLAKAAEKHQSMFIHISSDYVFDGLQSTSYKETDITNPLSIYGKSKLAGEQAVTLSCARSIILRTSWVFGEHGNNFVKTMLRLGKEKDYLGVVADQFGAPTSAFDIAKTIVSIVEQVGLSHCSNWGVYHYSGALSTSWYEFAQQIFSEAVKQGVLLKFPQVESILTSDYPTAAIRPKNSILNCSKIFSEFNISPSDWQSALRDLKVY